MSILKGQCHEQYWSRDCRIFFAFKDSTWALYEQAKPVLRAFSFSQRYLIAIFFFRYGHFHIFKYYFWVCKQTQVPFFTWLFHLKSVKSLQSFPKVSAMSCPCSRWLRGHTFLRISSRENERVYETVFVCSYGAQVESYKQKWSKISRHCPVKAVLVNIGFSENINQGRSTC